MVGVHDPFLDLGGDSLRASRIASRVLGTFDVDVPMVTLFKASTVASMAVVVVEALASRVAGANLEQMLAESERPDDVR